MYRYLVLVFDYNKGLAPLNQAPIHGFNHKEGLVHVMKTFNIGVGIKPNTVQILDTLEWEYVELYFDMLEYIETHSMDDVFRQYGAKFKPESIYNT